MSLIALYVYNPTTFTTDTPIDSMHGDLISAGQVTLQPGIYRLAGSATIAPTATPKGDPSFSFRAIDNTKGNPPDPPLAPMAGYTMSEINAFFVGAGEANAI